MGLFGSLFDKKECSICGGEIGLLGNRKLEDGNMCKKCANKLSPFFSDRRHSTIEEIKEQLKYREENKTKVAAFRATRTFGDYTKVFVDEGMGTFMVSESDSPKAWEEENPDVIDISAVSVCEVDTTVFKRELKYRDKDDKEQSYNPPRFEYSYDFYVAIKVRTLYFDEIRFKLNDSTIQIKSQAFQSGMFNFGYNSEINPDLHPEYSHYKKMGEELKAVLLSPVSPAAAAPVSQPETNQRGGFCTNCGAPASPTASFCEFCGNKLK